MAVDNIERFRNAAAALGRLALAAMLSGLMAGPVMGGDAQVWSAGFSLAARSGGEAPAAFMKAGPAGAPPQRSRSRTAVGVAGSRRGPR